MAELWPDGGAWVLATTSAQVEWRVPAAALAAASAGRVAVLVLGGDERPDAGLVGRFATVLAVRGAAAAPLSLGEAVGLVRALGRTHGLVLVVGVPGLLVPVDGAGWTAADLAAAVSAPVVVATGAGPEATNHTALALGALDGRGLRAAVVVVGGAAGADDDILPGLPVAPAGRIPADAAEGPGDEPAEFAAAARRWLNPILHAGTGDRERAGTPAPPAAPSPTTSGRRAVLLLAGAFVTMSLVACGLGFCGRVTTSAELAPHPPAAEPRATLSIRIAQPTPAPVVTRAVEAACPEHRAGVRATVPDRATTRRVDAAWRRIESWLAVHAPRSRRALRPPASPAAVDALQEQLSVPFPPDLVASLRRHDGAADFGFDLPFFFTPLPVDRIAGQWRTNCTVLAGTWEREGEDWWHPAFVPFAASGDGGCLLVDQRPGGHGRVGEFYAEDGVHFAGWPASVADLLEGTARSLETGRPYEGRYRPRVGADGLLNWEIV